MDQGSERRSLTIIHLALMMGCIMFLGVAWSMGPLDAPTPELTALYTGVGTAALLLIPLSFVVLRRKLREGSFLLHDNNSRARLRAALIMHYVLIEAPCMLNIVLLMWTGAMLHAWLALACLSVLALRAPTPARVQAWTGFSA